MENENLSEAAGAGSATNPYNSLNYNQKQKFDYLLPIYKDEQLTIELVKLIDGKGRNSWNSVNDKISEITDARIGDQQYHDQIYDNINVGESYSTQQIVGIIAQVRRDLRLRPYSSRLKANCEKDFEMLFIVHDVVETEIVDGKEKKTIVGSLPMFKLKPED